jgi:hypothetical protein
MHTHPILFVSRVEFIQAILAAAVRNSCPQDAVTILQYSQSTAGYNVPLCGLIQGVSSRQRPAGTVLPTAVITCHAQTYSQTAGRRIGVLISYSVATLGLAYTEVSIKYQSKTPNPGVLFFLILFSKCNESLTCLQWAHVSRNSFTCSHLSLNALRSAHCS